MQHAFDKRLPNRFISTDDNDECISLFHTFFLEKHEGFYSEKDQEAKGATFWRGAKLFISSDPERSTADFALLQQKVAFFFLYNFLWVFKLLFLIVYS